MHKTARPFLIVAACLFGAALHAAPVYTALGASDAIGTGSSRAPAVPNGGYVFVISDWLQARYPAWTLHNLGVSGYTAENIRDNSLQPAINDQPDIITVWVGGNDIKDSILSGPEDTATLAARFRPAYTTIIQRLRQETNAFIVTANLPDFSRIPIAGFFDDEYRALAKADSDALNAIIADVATAYQVPVVDLYSDPASYDPTNYSSDMFHPNDKGYAAMAQQYEAVLKAQDWRMISGLGDVSGDGSITPLDTAATLRILGGLSAPLDRQSVAADTFPPGGDGVIGIPDAVQTLRRAMGLVPNSDWK